VTPPRPTARRAAGPLLIALLAYAPALLSSPGLMPADTKLYLYLNPGRLMSDAAQSWDSRQFAGWAPHQIIAYLWPQGPWYWIAERIGLPDWIAHRLWIGTLLALGGLGVRWAARRLGIGSLGAIVAGIAYMLSPYVLPYISRTSAMLLPWAALGWLIGLTLRAAQAAAADGPRWRDPALMAIVLATVGAPNATALLMVAPGPVLLLLHLRGQLGLTWPALTRVALRIGVLALGVSVWWMTMLAIQGRYGADLLGYSESLEAVSFTSTSTEVLRGMGYWLFYVRDPYAFTTTASISYAESGRVIVVGAVLLVAGMAGTAAVRWPHRRLAALLVGAGVLLGVGAHPIDRAAPLIAPFTDSGLSLALRSSTRAVPLLTFGLALGLGALISAIAAARPNWRFAAAAFTLLLVLANMPSTVQRQYVDPALTRDQQPPRAWLDAAAALDAGSREHRVLQLPGQEFGAFRWGYTVDPPLPGLTEKPLITRDLLPLGSAGAMDLLYALDNRAQSGVLDPAAIAPIARLFGADTVWVTNDADFERFRTPRPDQFDALVAGAPQLTEADTYGRPVSMTAAAIDERTLAAAQSGLSAPPAVRLLTVDDSVPIVRTATRSVVVVGSGDGVVDAAAAGLLRGDEAVLYAAALPDRSDAQAVDYVVITDSNRRRANQWRSSQDTVGMTESAAERDAGVLRADDGDQRLPVFPGAPLDAYTTAEQRGTLTASASAYGEPFAYRPEQRAAMAVDGDPSTAWTVSDRADPVGQFIRVSGVAAAGGQLTLLQPQKAANRVITEVTITPEGGEPAVVTLGDQSLAPPGQTVSVPGADSATITITKVADRDGADSGASAVGFAELADPQLVAPTEEWVRTAVTPVELADAPTAVVLTRERTDPLNRWRSDPEPTLRRVVELPGPHTFEATVTVQLDARADDQAIAEFAGYGPVVAANQRLTGSLASTGWLAADGDPATQWTSPFGAAIGSQLTVPLTKADDRSVLITQPADPTHSQITAVEISIDGGAPQLVALEPVSDTVARVALPEQAGSVATITIAELQPRTTIDRRYAEPTVLPVAIVEIEGAAVARSTLQPPDGTSCLDLLTVNDAAVSFAVDGAQRSALLRGEAVQLSPCSADPLRLDGGEMRIAGLDQVVQVNRVSLTPEGGLPATGPLPPSVSRTGDRSYTVAACPEGCWLIFGEGHNPGWHATVNGANGGPPNVVAGGFNGWWIAPTDQPSTIEVRWAPQRTLRLALAISVAAVVAAVALAVGRRPRSRPAAAVQPTPEFDRSFAAPAGRRAALVGGAVLVGLSALAISASYGVVAVGLAAVVAATRRPRMLMAAGVAGAAVLMALVVIRQLSNRWFANAAWPARFDDLHRPGLLVVCAFAAGAIASHERVTAVPADAAEIDDEAEQAAATAATLG
jgi:arabinofuranan 3-O-arabinosyltransferase